ncbi:Uncharacterised protein [uncultured archaeon]|nr:Uncharacterised protein [uncultured archaeon]
MSKLIEIKYKDQKLPIRTSFNDLIYRLEGLDKIQRIRFTGADGEQHRILVSSSPETDFDRTSLNVIEKLKPISCPVCVHTSPQLILEALCQKCNVSEANARSIIELIDSRYLYDWIDKRLNASISKEYEQNEFE